MIDDGWYKMGDAGYYDDDCNLFVLGRVNNLISVNDKTVSNVSGNLLNIYSEIYLDALKVFLNVSMESREHWHWM